MKSLLYICLFILYFGSSVVSKPQEVKKSSVVTKPTIDFTPKVNYDSLFERVKQDAEIIKRDKEFIKKNEQYISNLEKKKEKLVTTIKSDLIKLESKKKLQQDTVTKFIVVDLDTVCITKKPWLMRKIFDKNECGLYRVDTIIIK